jgi:CcmD family protein
MNSLMTFSKRGLVIAGVLLALTTALPALAQPPAQPQQQNEYVPIDELPPQDQLPAAPLLVVAYAVVMLGLFAYVMSVARRMATVQRELERLESDLKRGSRA